MIFIYDIAVKSTHYFQIQMGSSIIMAGLGMAAVGFGGRYLARTMPQFAKRAEEVETYF